ncbi:MAG: glycosyltransferase, partial [Candidatus Cloacimonetes bacterium]|nr:glycosyltransferase [Candidatus Cloacimonadota bacterium]
IHVVNLHSSTNDLCENILISGSKEAYEGDMSYYADKYNVPIRYVKTLSREINIFKDIAAFWQLYRIIRQEKPDIVDTHTSKAGTLGRIAALLAGVKVRIYTFHGNIFTGIFGKGKSKIFLLIERFLARFTTKIIAISPKQKQELIDYKIAPAEKIAVIKLGYDFAHITPKDTDFGSLKQKYSIPDDACVVSRVCRLAPKNNVKLFIEIAGLLRDQNIYFFIVGDGEQRELLKDMINNKKLNKVIMTGALNDVKPVFADSDILLTTSLTEGTPIAIIEALINSVIVISTNVGGVADCMDDGVSGFIINEFDPQMFADKILDIIKGKIDKESIKKNARIKAETDFSLDRLAKQTVELYRETVG